MVTALAVLGVLAVLVGAAVVALWPERTGGLVDAAPDAADLRLPDGPLHPDDLGRLRFGMVVRGYRMSEVDRVLRRLADELDQRDRRIAELEGDEAGRARPTA